MITFALFLSESGFEDRGGTTKCKGFARRLLLLRMIQVTWKLVFNIRVRLEIVLQRVMKKCPRSPVEAELVSYEAWILRWGRRTHIRAIPNTILRGHSTDTYPNMLHFQICCISVDL